MKKTADMRYEAHEGRNPHYWYLVEEIEGTPRYYNTVIAFYGDYHEAIKEFEKKAREIEAFGAYNRILHLYEHLDERPLLSWEYRRPGVAFMRDAEGKLL